MTLGTHTVPTFMGCLHCGVKDVFDVVRLNPMSPQKFYSAVENTSVTNYCGNCGGSWISTVEIPQKEDVTK